MSTITIQLAQATLAELIHRLPPGEEVFITENDRTVTTLVMASAEPPRKVPQLGTLRGTVLSMEHFDDPLEELESSREVDWLKANS